MIAKAANKTRFNTMAHAAAEAERAMDYELAAKMWGEALAYAQQKVNQNWCQSRQDFCLRMLKKNGLREGQ